MKTYDFIIVGAGIVGLSLAYEIILWDPIASIIILEKEDYLGAHASGRNSGVIHAGFYYSEDSLKAKLTRSGNLLMHDFCHENNIQIVNCGKVVVTSSEQEENQLDILAARGFANDVPLEIVDSKQLKEIEPVASTCRRAIYSPSTSYVNPLSVLDSLKNRLLSLNVTFSFNEAFLSYKNGIVETTKARYSPGFIINTAGTYAQKIASVFGFGRKYQIMPFKGLYLISKNKLNFCRRHIYPVPDLANPFLGVHLTRSYSGNLKIGPTATPALWNENYQGLKKFSFQEMKEISTLGVKLLKYKHEFRSLALREFRKIFKSSLISDALKLAPSLPIENFVSWGKPGIRAQLVDLEKNKLEMDFVVEGDKKSLHILNSISPAFTCGFSFARLLIKKIIDSQT